MFSLANIKSVENCTLNRLFGQRNSMKIFNYFRTRLLCAMGVRYWNSTFGKIWFTVSKYCYYGVSVLVLLSLFSFCSTTAKSFSEFLEAFFYIMICFLLLWWFAVFQLHKQKHKNLIRTLEAIIEKRISNSASRVIYEDTNILVDKLTKYMFTVLVEISCPSFMVPLIVLSIYRHMTNESFLQIFPGTFPFDWKTPRGYFVCCFLQAVGTFASGICFMCAISFIIGFCLFLTALISDLEANLNEFNTLINSERRDIGDDELRRTFSTIIQLYSDAKIITVHFSEISEPIIFPYLGYAILSFCSLFAQIDMSLATASIISILHFVIPASVGIFWLYIFCFFGNHLTQRFEDFNDAVYQIDWNILPLHMQKDLPILMALAQKNVYIQGYGGIECTCWLFTRIMKTTFSYFMVLREFY